MAIIDRLNKDIQGRHLNSNAGYRAQLRRHEVICYDATVLNHENEIRRLKKKLEKYE